MSDDLIGRLAVNLHGANLEAIARIKQLTQQRDSFQRQAENFARRGNLAESDLAAARNVIAAVKHYADDRAYRASQKNNTVGSWRIASDLNSILDGKQPDGVARGAAQ